MSFLNILLNWKASFHYSSAIDDARIYEICIDEKEAFLEDVGRALVGWAWVFLGKNTITSRRSCVGGSRINFNVQVSGRFFRKFHHDARELHQSDKFLRLGHLRLLYRGAGPLHNYRCHRHLDQRRRKLAVFQRRRGRCLCAPTSPPLQSLRKVSIELPSLSRLSRGGPLLCGISWAVSRRASSELQEYGIGIHCRLRWIYRDAVSHVVG